MIFRVMLHGEKIKIRMDDVDVDCGFVKNEYVWAASESDAILIAKRRILIEVKKNSALQLASDFIINVEEVEPSVSFFKLLRREGIILFPV